jgi:chromate transporter
LLLALLQFNYTSLAPDSCFILESLTNKIRLQKGTVDSADTFPVSKTALLAPTNFNLFLIFLKIGAILYGSGYVLFCFFGCRISS